MRAGVVLLVVIFGLLAAGPAALGQITTDDLQDPGPRDQAVDSAITWNRLQDQIKYLRPGADFRPDQEIEIEIPPPRKDLREVREDNRFQAAVIAFLVLAIVVIVLIVFGGRINVSFRRTVVQIAAVCRYNYMYCQYY